jgi:hypothetical protein
MRSLKPSRDRIHRKSDRVVDVESGSKRRYVEDVVDLEANAAHICLLV